ncbi:MAG: DUF1569 domain-containing protein [Bacteroidetes bacterium]|nr:DUF1569 domain-containing protein [Bacteroidota bacterium]
MKHNVLDAETSHQLAQRASKLTADHRALWGKMTVTEMLLHCNLCNTQILTEGRKPGDRTTVKQFALRIVALYVAGKFTKNRPTDHRHNAQGHAPQSQFQVQQAAFINLVGEFPKQTAALTLTHPAFGNISTREWGIAAYKHMDHHLRQFGV